MVKIAKKLDSLVFEDFGNLMTHDISLEMGILNPNKCFIENHQP